MSLKFVFFKMTEQLQNQLLWISTQNDNLEFNAIVRCLLINDFYQKANRANLKNMASKVFAIRQDRQFRDDDSIAFTWYVTVSRCLIIENGKFTFGRRDVVGTVRNERRLQNGHGKATKTEMKDGEPMYCRYPHQFPIDIPSTIYDFVMEQAYISCLNSNVFFTQYIQGLITEKLEKYNFRTEFVNMKNKINKTYRDFEQVFAEYDSAKERLSKTHKESTSQEALKAIKQALEDAKQKRNDIAKVINVIKSFSRDSQEKIIANIENQLKNSPGLVLVSSD